MLVVSAEPNFWRTNAFIGRILIEAARYSGTREFEWPNKTNPKTPYFSLFTDHFSLLMLHFDLCVIGAGPAGYAAAMRAVDFGKRVLLIEKDKLGGAGLHNGALSSKTFWEK